MILFLWYWTIVRRVLDVSCCGSLCCDIVSLVLDGEILLVSVGRVVAGLYIVIVFLFYWTGVLGE